MVTIDVSGLSRHLHSSGEFNDKKLKNINMVVDLIYFSNRIATSSNIHYQYAGSNMHLVSKMDAWLKAFDECQIKPLFVIRTGLPRELYPTEPESWRETNNDIVAKLENVKLQGNDGNDADEVDFKTCIRGVEEVFIDLATRRGHELVYLAPYSGHAGMISLAANLNCPYLSNRNVKIFTDPGFKIGDEFCYTWFTTSEPTVVDKALVMKTFSPAKSFLTRFKSQKWPIVAALMQCNSRNNLKMPGTLYYIKKTTTQQRDDNYITAMLDAISRYLKQKTHWQIYQELLRAQQSDERRAYLQEHLFLLFLELYPSPKFAKDLANAFGLSTLNLPQSRHYSYDPENSLESSITAMLNGSRYYPSNCSSIAITETGYKKMIKRMQKNNKRWIYALYGKGGHYFRIRVEEYGNLSSYVLISAKLRQIIYGIFLEIEKRNPTIVLGYDATDRTVTEFIHQFQQFFECKMPIRPLRLDQASSFFGLMRSNGDLDLSEVKDLPLDSWAVSTVLIAVYWYQYTSLENVEVKNSVLSTFITMAIFFAFVMRETDDSKSETFFEDVFEFFDEYANQLKAGAVDKTLTLAVVHALSELAFLPQFFRNLNDLIPNEREKLHFLDSYELLPHNRLFHWMSVHNNIRTNHVKNLCSYLSQHKQETSSRVENMINQAFAFSQNLIAKLKPKRASDVYILMRPTKA
ncbi:hypothetical protein Ciccas_008557 [Cichlidogyrus casuarinus]|uniref:XPG N-terminal domain-containing protein n=1 Tax=Cichlidogyrus casuarinus TaxID=1844966 RepID=A0ABD2Q0X8_9PLAT